MQEPAARNRLAGAVQRALQRTASQLKASGRPRILTQWRPSLDWRVALIETITVIAVAIALSVWLRPYDPLWTAGSFPWLTVVVVVMALRYGSTHAVVGIGTSLTGWLLLDSYVIPLGEFPRANFLGGLVLGLIAGEFSDVWNARLNRGHAVNTYLEERLQALTQHHFLLSVSHDRLEQELLARPFTLRETLFALRQSLLPRQVLDAKLTTSDLPAGAWLLQLLARSCRLETAALFVVQDGKLHRRPAALIGDFAGAEAQNAKREVSDSGEAAVAAADPSDPMLIAALDTGELMHVQSQPFIDSDRPSRYVICAPITSSAGHLLGMLLVERIAFTALTLETLQFLTVLLAYYGDSLDHSSSTAPVLASYPLCREEFALEIVRLQRLRRTAFIRSSLTAFALPPDPEQGEAWAKRLESMIRSIDVSWQYVGTGLRVLLVVLPLTDPAGLAGFIDRINRNVRENYGADLAGSGISTHTAELREDPLVVQINRLLEQCRA